jgi:hypothetical protein
VARGTQLSIKKQLVVTVVEAQVDASAHPTTTTKQPAAPLAGPGPERSSDGAWGMSQARAEFG